MRAFWENMQQTSAEKIWASAQEQLRSLLSADTYNLWFAPVRASSQENDSLVLEVANEFCEVWLKDNYLGLLQEVVQVASGQKLLIKFRVSSPSIAIGPVQLPSSPKAKATLESATDRNGPVQELSFNPKNTFETFVVGNNNNFAYAAALAVAQAPGK